MTFGFQVMMFGPKILAFLLIAALAMAMSADARAEVDYAQASSARPLAAPAPSERAAGCHAHSGTSSSVRPTHSLPPTPVSHQCCLTGHDAAVVQVSHYTTPCHQVTRVTLLIAPALTECSFNGSEVSMVLAPDPPGITPLRI